jgi:hypothetical protein
MTSITFTHFYIFLLIISVATSCKKDNSPEKVTSGHGDISYFAKASGTGIKTSTVKSNSILANQVSVNWSSASVYIEKISFVGKSNNLIDTTIVVEKNANIFSADALAGIIRLPAGSYKDVKVKLFLKKSPYSELAFNLGGTFINTQGIRDSLIVASSLPFEANLAVTDIIIDSEDNYKVTFNFDLNKVLTGISTELLQTVPSHIIGPNKLRTYAIWKGGSQDVLLYNQVTTNWQTVASVAISKK